MMKKQFDEDYFNGVGSGYKAGYKWSKIGYLSWHRFKEIFFHSHFKHGRWLDAGCAKGFLLRIAIQYGWETYGFDISSHAVNETRTICPSANVFLLDAEKGLPFPDEFFEVITACELIEHLPQPESFLEESYRILKPGGLFFISTPNVNSVLNSSFIKDMFAMFGWSTPFDDETHVSYFDSNSITKALKKCGFLKVKAMYSFDFLRKLNIHTPSGFGWTLLTFTYR